MAVVSQNYSANASVSSVLWIQIFFHQLYNCATLVDYYTITERVWPHEPAIKAYMYFVTH